MMRRRLGALSSSAEQALRNRLNEVDFATQDGWQALNKARQIGANLDEVAAIDAAYDQFILDLQDADMYVDASADAAQADAMITELEQRWAVLKARIDRVAGTTFTGKLVLWGTLAVVGAGALAYFVYRHRSRRRT